jgi:hypothetical protein
MFDKNLNFKIFYSQRKLLDELSIFVHNLKLANIELISLYTERAI